VVGGKIEQTVESSCFGDTQVLTVPNDQSPKQPQHNCPQCGGTRFFRAGMRHYPNGSQTQRWLCRNCNHRFTERPKPLKTAKRKINCQNSYESNNGGRARNLLAEGYNLVNSESRQEDAQREGTQQTPLDNNGKIVQFLWEMKKNGVTDATIRTWSSTLNKLAKHTDMTPENVKEYLSKTTDWSNRTKISAVVTYNCFLTHYGITWKPPKYKSPDKLHFIPTEAEIDSLIAGSGKVLSAFLQLLKETGARGGEAANTLWKDVDFERKIVHITPEKGSKARILPISDTLVGMLKRVPKNHGERIFVAFSSMTQTFQLARKGLIYKLQNPRLKDIHIHTFRHWKATMEYHRTKDILHVKHMLGHKNINCTLIYIDLENILFKNTTDEYTTKVATTIEEACALLEVGFEYVTDMEGVKLFRKRK
jgi:integrase